MKKMVSLNKENDDKIAKYFLIISLIVGMLLIYIVPPFQSPDENSHFLKSYAISTGHVYPIYKDDALRFYIPKTLVDYSNYYNKNMGKKDFKYSYDDFYEEEYGKYSFSEKDYYTFSTASSSPLCHVIPAMGIIFTKILTHIGGDGRTSPLMMLHGARLFCLIFYIILGYFSIKKAPIFKRSIFVILLLPMSLYLGSSVTYDGLLYGTILLGVAEILHLIYAKDKVEKKDLILLSLITLILLSVKVIYSLFLILLIFIPKEKFGENKDKIIKIFGIFFVALLLYLFFKVPNIFLKNIPSDALVTEQIKYVLHHPFNTIWTFVNNFFESSENLMFMMMGSFGLFEAKLPYLVMYLGFICLISIFISDSSMVDIKTKKYSKIVISLIGICIAFLIYAAMYITWTPIMLKEVGGSIVEGVQGRYFLPLLIIIPYVIINTKLVRFNKVNKIVSFINKNYYFYSCIMLIFALFIIILRFWA